MPSDDGSSISWTHFFFMAPAVALLLACGSSKDASLFDADKSAGATGLGGSSGPSQGGTKSGGAGGSAVTSGGTKAEAGGSGALGGADQATGGASGGSGGASAGGANSSGGIKSSIGGASAGVGTAGSGGGSGCVPTAETCDGVDNDCNSVIDGAKACPVHCSGFLLEGQSHMVCTLPVPQASVEAACEAEGMRATWIETDAENTGITQAITRLTSAVDGAELLEVFLGATDAEVEGAWHWIGGEPFWQGAAAGMAVGTAYSNWGASRPNNSGSGAVGGEDCAVLIIGTDSSSGSPGEWNDAPCAELHGFICERPE